MLALEREPGPRVPADIDFDETHPYRRRVSLATRARTGASPRQGTHQEPQKLTTTVRPRQLAVSRCAPASEVPARSGACGRWAGGMTGPTAGTPQPAG